MYTTTLADPVRLQQFSLLCGTVRPFQGHGLAHDENGRAWACSKLHDYLLAVPATRLEAGLSFGIVAERVLWTVHYEVRRQRIPQIRFERTSLCRVIWGTMQTRRSLQTLRQALRGLAELRVAEWSASQDSPPLAQSLPLFEQIVEESGSLTFVVGEGFLGSLERFAVQVDGNTRYDFPAGKRLKKLRKEQRVQDVFLPIYLGDLAACRQFSPRQKRLFQAVYREKTCPPKLKGPNGAGPAARSLDMPQVITGDKVVAYNPARMVECPYLDPLVNYVGFNGNGVRRGCGYRLRTWMRKAGYADAEYRTILDDLSALSRGLGITVAAIGPGNENWQSLGQVTYLATAGGRARRKLDGLHVRMYAKAGCFEQWNKRFHWDAGSDGAGKQEGVRAIDVLERLREILRSERLQQQQIAAQFGIKKQYLSAVLKGKKRCSDKVRIQIEEFIADHVTTPDNGKVSPLEPLKFDLLDVQVKAGSSTLGDAALHYHDQGLCVIPIRSWEVSRKPFVKWTQFQTERPTRLQVKKWWTTWPDAGIAVVLGSVSNLFCVDCDGENAYRILMDLLGKIPLAPTVKSGGADPFRFHLYFRHPAIETWASKTPWNASNDVGKLELRGATGLAILPPSLHKSGRRYAWVNGRSLDDVALPELPDVLLEGLEAAMAPPVDAPEFDDGDTAATAANGQAAIFAGYHVAPSTARFLAGLHTAPGSRNNRLFRAGCDLFARGVPQAKAEQLLLAGAKMTTPEDEQTARDTIASAYSRPRTPSRY
jgi:transcriptional regulator with XRE-family HTH domain